MVWSNLEWLTKDVDSEKPIDGNAMNGHQPSLKRPAEDAEKKKGDAKNEK